jgi:hypothetical protein
MRLRYTSETPTFYQNYLAMRNTADVTSGQPIAVLLKSISGVSAINLLVAFYDIHGRKRGAIILFCPRPHTFLIKKNIQTIRTVNDTSN